MSNILLVKRLAVLVESVTNQSSKHEKFDLKDVEGRNFFRNVF